MRNENMDTLTRARVLHAAEVERANTPEALEAALQEALQAGDLETAAQIGRMKRNVLLKDVDAHGSVYRLELPVPEEDTLEAWALVLRQFVATFGDAWAQYRRALLDVPQQEGYPETIQWPEKPEL